jgi:hypothetical protein
MQIAGLAADAPGTAIVVTDMRGGAIVLRWPLADLRPAAPTNARDAQRAQLRAELAGVSELLAVLRWPRDRGLQQRGEARQIGVTAARTAVLREMASRL